MCVLMHTPSVHLRDGQDVPRPAAPAPPRSLVGLGGEGLRCPSPCVGGAVSCPLGGGGGLLNKEGDP